MFVTLTVLGLAVLMLIVERLRPGRNFPAVRGLHAFNYGDLPVRDMMFGTFRNPKAWDAKCGFSDDRELRVGDLLLGRDVNAA